MSDFAPIAAALRAEVKAFYVARGGPLAASAGDTTLETNSGLVEQRGRPLVDWLGGSDSAGAQPLAGLKLLDVGCGFGALAMLFAASGARVTGIDPNEERFAVGRAVAERFELPVSFVRGEMQAMPLSDAQFDLAVLNNSLCYVVSPKLRHRGLTEVRRILRPGGKVVLRNPNRWHPRDQFTALPVVHWLPPEVAVAVAGRLGRRRSFVRLTSPQAAARELLAAGFVDVARQRLGGSRRSEALKLVERYHHFTARRPAV